MDNRETAKKRRVCKPSAEQVGRVVGSRLFSSSEWPWEVQGARDQAGEAKGGRGQMPKGQEAQVTGDGRPFRTHQGGGDYMGFASLCQLGGLPWEVPPTTREQGDFHPHYFSSARKSSTAGVHPPSWMQTGSTSLQPFGTMNFRLPGGLRRGGCVL